MSTFLLLRKELVHRKTHTLLAVLLVTLMVSLIVVTQRLSDAYESKTAQHITQLDDEIRKTMKELGFNIFILPADLNLANFFEQDFGRETMDEQLVHQLAAAKDVVTINHLRPALIQKVHWPEQSRDIILMGVKGVVPWSHRKNPKTPLAQPVPPDTIHLGNVLAKQLDVGVGDELTLAGRNFSVGEVYPARGNQDDISAWIDLVAVQEITGNAGRINMIQALNCNCASIDALAEIEAEISGVLGNQVKVIELNSELIARAQARTKVGQSGKENLRLLRQASTASYAILVGFGSLMLAFLCLRNANERKSEVGMLRAIGVSRNQILALFLAKSTLLGFMGGLLGVLSGLAIATAVSSSSNSFVATPINASAMVATPFVAAVISVLATWIPTESIAGKDPAVMLREAS